MRCYTKVKEISRIEMFICSIGSRSNSDNIRIPKEYDRYYAGKTSCSNEARGNIKQKQYP